MMIENVKFFREVFQSNPNGRDFVIGDLHGCYGFLMSLLQRVNFDKTKDRLFSVGDLIDRGPNSLECLMLILEPWFHAVKGNHENMLQWYLADPDNAFLNEIFMRNGGKWVLVEDSKLLESFSETINDLPTFMTVKKKDGTQFHILHAELLSPVPLTDEDIEDEEILKKVMTSSDPTEHAESILWSRQIFRVMYDKVHTEHNLEKFKRGQNMNRWSRVLNDKLSTIYSGHTIMTGKPLQFENQIVLDTGSYYGLHYEDHGVSMVEPETGECWISNFQGVKNNSITKIAK